MSYSSLSRFAVKDFKLDTCEGYSRLQSPCLSSRRFPTHLDVRGEISVPEKVRSCVIQSRKWSPVVAAGCSPVLLFLRAGSIEASDPVTNTFLIIFKFRLQVSMGLTLTFEDFRRCLRNPWTSSALGFLLAQKHFTNPLVAVPSAVSVVCMALGGSGLAVYWMTKMISRNEK